MEKRVEFWWRDLKAGFGSAFIHLPTHHQAREKNMEINSGCLACIRQQYWPSASRYGFQGKAPYSWKLKRFMIRFVADSEAINPVKAGDS
ncbi:MAG: hypothetical protein FJX32_04815 [Alphaproteobacteria bacterium]|nr:hypothetical protein [Alphaproteobacteria bacterium]